MRVIITLQERIAQLCKQHGSMRAAARAIKIDPGYLSRLASGDKESPSKKTLYKLGLQQVVLYRTIQ